MGTTKDQAPDSHPPTLRQEALPRSAKVVALVLNSVSHDARVLKEADSLARVGLDVTIVGIQDARGRVPAERRLSGVVIRRANYQAVIRVARELRRYRVWLAILGLGLVMAIGVLTGVIGPFLEPLSDLVRWLGGRAIPSLALLGSLALSVFAARKVRSHYRVLARLAADMAGPTRGVARPASVRLMRAVLRAWARVRAALDGRLRVRLQRTRQQYIESMYLAELARLKPDVVHCHDLTTLSSGVKWCRRSPVTRLVLDSHELYEEVARMSPSLRRYWQGVLRSAAPSVNRFITVNDGIATEYQKRYPELAPAVVIRNAVLPPDGPPTRDDRLREAAGLGPDHRVLLYQGGFAGERGLESLVKAAGSLPEPWVLVMMGWGNIESDLRRMAEQVDPTGDRIRFLPGAPQDELIHWTSGADLGVIPYENTCMNHWLCSPNKLWEYPVAGVPMLVSDFPILREVAVGEGVGMVLPALIDGSALADLIQGVTPDDLDRMRRACEDFIARDNWSVYERRLQDLYRTLLDR
jgi:glycosyltransferase involved in cell wall biosynthesis